MIIRTKGIVLSHFPYKESSIICKIFTEELGVESFIIHNVRSKKNNTNVIFLQPLNLVDLDIYHKPKASLHRIKEHRTIFPFHSIPFNQNKRAITFFLTEAIEKCLKEEQPNREIFAFLTKAIELFDTQEQQIENFHLFILFTLTKFLGFFPHPPENENELYFDLLNGKYVAVQPHHNHYLNPSATKIWLDLSEMGEKLLDNHKIERSQRSDILANLLEYYKLHIPEFGTLKTIDILHQIFK